jgi:predicted DNA-binding transcriptional regulator AlpA
MKQSEITKRVEVLRANIFTDEEISMKIGISKPTLYTRLKKDNWKKSEIFLIKSFTI